eukprot:g6660.t1
MQATASTTTTRLSASTRLLHDNYITGESSQLEVGQLRQYLMERDAVIGQLESLLQDQSARFRQSMQQVQQDLFTATKGEKEMQVLLRSRQSQDNEEKLRLSMEKQRLELELEHAAKTKQREELEWRQKADDLEKQLTDFRLDEQRLAFLEKENKGLKGELEDLERQIEVKGALIDKLENEKIDLEKGARGRIGNFAAERQHRLEKEKLQQEVDMLRRQLTTAAGAGAGAPSSSSSSPDHSEAAAAAASASAEQRTADDEAWLQKLEETRAHYEAELQHVRSEVENSCQRLKQELEIEKERRELAEREQMSLQGKLRMEKHRGDEENRRGELEKEEMDSRLAVLRQELEETRTAITAERAELEQQMRREVERRLQEKEAESDRKSRGLTDNFDVERRDFVTRIADLERAVNERGVECASLRDQLASAGAEGTRLQGEVERCRAEREQAVAAAVADKVVGGAEGGGDERHQQELQLPLPGGPLDQGASVSKVSSVVVGGGPASSSSSKRSVPGMRAAFSRSVSRGSGRAVDDRSRSPNLLLQQQRQLKEKLRVLETENVSLKKTLEKRSRHDGTGGGSNAGTPSAAAGSGTPTLTELRSVKKKLIDREKEVAELRRKLQSSVGEVDRGGKHIGQYLPPRDSSVTPSNHDRFRTSGNPATSSFSRSSSTTREQLLLVTKKEDEIKRLKAENTELRSRVEELHYGQDQLSKSACSSSSQREVEHTEEKQKLQITVESLTSQVREMERRLAEEAGASRHLEAENVEKRRRVRELEALYEEADRAREELEEKVVGLNRHVADVSEKQAQLRVRERATEDELGEELRESRASEQRLRAELEGLRADVTSASKRSAKLEDQLDAEASRCSLLEQTIEILNKEKSLLQEEIRDLERQVTERSMNFNVRASLTSGAGPGGGAGAAAAGAGAPPEPRFSEAAAHTQHTDRAPAPNFVARTPAASKNGEHHYNGTSTPGSVLFGTRGLARGGMREPSSGANNHDRRDYEYDLDRVRGHQDHVDVRTLEEFDARSIASFSRTGASHNRTSRMFLSDQKATGRRPAGDHRSRARNEHYREGNLGHGGLPGEDLRSRYNDAGSPRERSASGSRGRGDNYSNAPSRNTNYPRGGMSAEQRRHLHADTAGAYSSSDEESVFLSRRTTAMRKPLMSRSANPARGGARTGGVKSSRAAKSDSSSEGSLERIVRESDPLFRGSRKKKSSDR